MNRLLDLGDTPQNAASSLREADKWVALAQSLEDTLDSGVPTNKEKLATLAEQVHAMTTSLEVRDSKKFDYFNFGLPLIKKMTKTLVKDSFQQVNVCIIDFQALSDSAEYESKRLQLTTLYNRLEAAISPPFMEALTMMDAGNTQRRTTTLSPPYPRGEASPRLLSLRSLVVLRVPVRVDVPRVVGAPLLAPGLRRRPRLSLDETRDSHAAGRHTPAHGRRPRPGSRHRETHKQDGDT